MRLVIIDSSLGDADRPHPYHALHGPLVAHAAVAAGRDVVVAGHRGLAVADLDLPRCRVERVFSRGVYWRWDLTEVPFQPSALIASEDELEAQIAEFADACVEVLDRIGVQTGDLFYLPMSSEYHLVGLARALRARPESIKASWHVQFHFQIARGRDWDVATPGTPQAQTRAVLARALAHVPNHRVFLYATNRALTAQLAHLGVCPVETLPRPSSRQIEPVAPPSEMPSPLRLTVAGALRATKMAAYEKIVAALGPGLAAGDVQLVVQVPHGHPLRSGEGPGWRTSTEPLVAAPYPMSSAEYAELIRHTHVGLFPYDAEVYRARLSGVLYETLCAGVPVLVPEGCALSDEIDAAEAAVGVRFGPRRSVADALDDIVARWREYKTNAVAYSARFRRANSASALVAVLEARASAGCVASAPYPRSP